MEFSPNLLEFTIQFAGSGSQLSHVFNLRPLSYLEHSLSEQKATEATWLCRRLSSCIINRGTVTV